MAIEWHDELDKPFERIPEIIEIIDGGTAAACKDAAGRTLWKVKHPTIKEWQEHRNYGAGRYTDKDLAEGVFWGGCIKNGFAIITFALRSQLMVNISYVARTGELNDIHEFR